jgi:hypothetical protein
MVAVSAVAGAGSGPRASPGAGAREYVETDAPPSTGRTIHVPAGGDLQQALDAARPGDVVALQAGATYVGHFVLPRKDGDGWIVSRTDAADSRLLDSVALRVGPRVAHACFVLLQAARLLSKLRRAPHGRPRGLSRR